MSEVQNAYLTSVYQNAYQYNEIDTMGIVYKNTASTFASLIGDSTNIGGVIQWTGSDWNFAKLSDIEGGFNWVGDSDVNGVIINQGSAYSQLAITDGETVAINYADNTLSAIPLNVLATEAAVSSLTTSGNYVINRDASGAWTYASIPDYIAEPALATSGEAYVYVKDASGANSFVRATPLNVYGQDLSGKVVYVNAESEWEGIQLPAAAGTNSQAFYHLTASTDATGAVTYSYTEVIDATSVSGFNFQSVLTQTTPINTTDIAMTDDVTGFVSDVNYLIDATFDIYVNDITMLANAEFVGENIYAELPVLTVKNGSGASGVVVGTYVIKPNQPFQTVHVNKVFEDLATAPKLYVSVTYNSVPASATDFIKYMNGSLMATATPCGSHDHSHTDESA